MREIRSAEITEKVAKLAQEANFYLNDDLLNALDKAAEEEISEPGRYILEQIKENAQIAASENVPVCQDTGVAVVFIKIGNDVHLDGDLYEAIEAGIRKGYSEGYLRKSIVADPLSRQNTGDNTPAIIHTEIVPGDQLEIVIAPKGGGSENMSRITMLKPGDGKTGVKDFVIETIEKAGANACPPLVVGVGIGGNFEKSAYLAKKSLLRDLDDHHADPEIAKFEAELLEAINKTGIGPQGMGGRTTALAVKIEVFATHIAQLPVAVNLNCHAARHKKIII